MNANSGLARYVTALAIPSIVPPGAMPALLTRMASRPRRSMVVETAARAASGSPASAPIEREPPVTGATLPESGAGACRLGASLAVKAPIWRGAGRED